MAVKSSSFQLVFPSEIEYVDLAHAVSDRVAGLVGMDEDEALNLGLAIREATINAIKHGNGLDPGKKVTVGFRFGPGEVVVTVRDSGPGFDPAQAPDPTLPENLHRSEGRGLLLMKAFVDSVEVLSPKDGGNVVRLTKRVGAVSGPAGRGGS